MNTGCAPRLSNSSAFNPNNLKLSLALPSKVICQINWAEPDDGVKTNYIDAMIYRNQC